MANDRWMGVVMLVMGCITILGAIYAAVVRKFGFAIGLGAMGAVELFAAYYELKENVW